jgi:hypothetical protein
MVVIFCSRFIALAGLEMIKIEKPKLPKGLSYALKTSILQAALDEARIECYVHLSYWRPQTGFSVLDAQYWLPSQNVPYPRVYLRAGVVPSSHHRAASDAMEKNILPAFTAWLSRILALPENSPVLHSEPYFNAEYDNGKIAIANNFSR